MISFIGSVGMLVSVFLSVLAGLLYLAKLYGFDLHWVTSYHLLVLGLVPIMTSVHLFLLGVACITLMEDRSE